MRRRCMRCGAQVHAQQPPASQLHERTHAFAPPTPTSRPAACHPRPAATLSFYDSTFYASCSPLGRPPRDWARAYALFVPTDDPARDLGVRGQPAALLRSLCYAVRAARFCVSLCMRASRHALPSLAHDACPRLRRLAPCNHQPQTTIRPWDLARRLAAFSDLPSHSYGLMLLPRAFGATPGLLVAIVWSTDDWEQLDVAEMPGDPVRFSHTCHNFIGAVPPPPLPAPS